jgi:hypothetical protein
MMIESIGQSKEVIIYRGKQAKRGRSIMIPHKNRNSLKVRPELPLPLYNAFSQR